METRALPRRIRRIDGIELPRVDGRLLSARRFRAHVRRLTEELGGASRLTAADHVIIKQVVTLTMAAEDMQAASAAGKHVDTDALIRISSEARRAFAALKSKAAEAKPAGHQDALAAHLRAKYGATIADGDNAEEVAVAE